jgi:hypothetical protein
VAAPGAASSSTSAADARQLAAESLRRRRSFESKYSTLLSSAPDSSAAAAANPDDEVVLDFDAHGKIKGAFTRREVRAQTARFKAQIASLTKEHTAVAMEVAKLAAVHPKLAAVVRAERVAVQTLESLSADLSALMSRYRSVVLEAQAHGLVVGSDHPRHLLDPDDAAEHAIWAEDGFTGEAHIPALTMDGDDDDDDDDQGWTPHKQIQYEARIKREAEEDKAAEARDARDVELAAAANESSVSNDDPSVNVGSESSAAFPTDASISSPVSPGSPGSPSVSAPRLSPSALAALAQAAREDADDEGDDHRFARSTWEDSLREEFEKKAADAEAEGGGNNDWGIKLARFSARRAKAQKELDSLRAQSSTEAELLRERVSKLSDKIAAVLAAKEAAFVARVRTLEADWQAQWEAGYAERQERRAAARAEADRAEEAAIKLEAARLKKEKRQAANASANATGGAKKGGGTGAPARKAPALGGLPSPRSSRTGPLLSPTQRAQAEKLKAAAISSSTSASAPAATPMPTPAVPVAPSEPLAVSPSGSSSPSRSLAQGGKRAPVGNDLSFSLRITGQSQSSPQRTGAAATGPLSIQLPRARVGDIDEADESESPRAVASSAHPSAPSDTDAAQTAAVSSFAVPVGLPLELLPLHHEHARLQHAKQQLAARIAKVKRDIARRKGIADDEEGEPQQRHCPQDPPTPDDSGGAGGQQAVAVAQRENRNLQASDQTEAEMDAATGTASAAATEPVPISLSVEPGFNATTVASLPQQSLLHALHPSSSSPRPSGAEAAHAPPDASVSVQRDAESAGQVEQAAALTSARGQRSQQQQQQQQQQHPRSSVHAPRVQVAQAEAQCVEAASSHVAGHSFAAPPPPHGPSPRRPLATVVSSPSDLSISGQKPGLATAAAAAAAAAVPPTRAAASHGSLSRGSTVAVANASASAIASRTSASSLKSVSSAPPVQYVSVTVGAPLLRHPPALLHGRGAAAATTVLTFALPAAPTAEETFVVSSHAHSQ